MRFVRLAVVHFTVIYGPGQCPDVSVNPEAGLLVWFLLAKLLRIRSHSAPPNETSLSRCRIRPQPKVQAERP